MSNIVNKIKSFIAAISIIIIQSASGQWERTNFPLFRNNRPRHIFQFEKGLYAVNLSSLYKSTDNGLNWSLVSDWHFFHALTDIEEIGNIFIATTYSASEWPDTTARAFRSFDGGQTWDSLFFSVYGGESIEKLNSKLYMDNSGYLYCSADTGKNWVKINTPNEFPKKISKVIVSGNSIYIRVKTEQLFKSDDEGLTWTLIFSTNFESHFYHIVIKDSIIFIGTFSAGCLKSTNIGLSWEKMNYGLPESSGFSQLLLCDEYVIASVSKDFYQSVYKINHNDTTWCKFNDGLNLAQTDYINDFAYNKQYLFLASDSGLWRRPISELVTSVDNNDVAIIPEEFNLASFPNPFNSSTTIRFNVTSGSYIQLKIYDILGREVENLFDGNLDSGDKSFIWNASEASSGIYFVRLSSDNHFETTKIILMK